jgi:hypothetical protein
MGQDPMDGFFCSDARHDEWQIKKAKNKNKSNK